MKKHWKSGTVILILTFAIAVFSISVASKDDKPSSNASPEIAQARQRRIPPALREKIRNNPELRKKFIRQFRSERTSEAEPSPDVGEPVDQSEKTPEKNRKKNDADYYKVIVAQNLFRPLGSGAENKGPSFGLLGTVIAKTEGEVDWALIMDYHRNRSVYVAEGEKIGEATVEEIEPRSVKLLHKGEMVNFSIQSVQFIGAKGGGGGGEGSRGGGSSSSKGSGGQDKTQQKRMAEMQKRFQQDMKNRSREEIEKMKQMMESRERGRRDRSNRGRGRRGGNRMLITK